MIDHRFWIGICMAATISAAACGSASADVRLPCPPKPDSFTCLDCGPLPGMPPPAHPAFQEPCWANEPVIAEPAGPVTPPVRQGDSYSVLVARARNGEMVDFTALREAYARSAGYDPYGDRIMADREAMLTAFNHGDCDAVAAHAQQILAADFIHADAHLLLGTCRERQGDDAGAGREFTITHALLDAIIGARDGTTPATAFEAVEIFDEYSVLGVLGLTPGRQALVNENGHSYDRFEVTSAHGDKILVYFRIDDLFGALQRELHQR